MAAADGRDKLGGDIMIHGRNMSVGCLAMGDPAIEEIFVLGALVRVENIDVIISPVDSRTKEMPALPANGPQWIGELYGQIRSALSAFPLP